MTQEKSHPPTKPFTPDPTKKSNPPRRDPASDLPTDPPRHGASEHATTGSRSNKNEGDQSKTKTPSTRGGTSAQHAKVGSQSKKNK